VDLRSQAEARIELVNARDKMKMAYIDTVYLENQPSFVARDISSTMKLISQSYSSRLKVPVVLNPTIASSDVVIMHALFPNSSIAVKGDVLPGLECCLQKHKHQKTGQTLLKPTL